MCQFVTLGVPKVVGAMELGARLLITPSQNVHVANLETEPARRFREGVLGLLDRSTPVRLFVYTDDATEVVVSKGTVRISRAAYKAGAQSFPEDTLIEIGG